MKEMKADKANYKMGVKDLPNKSNETVTGGACPVAKKMTPGLPKMMSYKKKATYGSQVVDKTIIKCYMSLYKPRGLSNHGYTAAGQVNSVLHDKG